MHYLSLSDFLNKGFKFQSSVFNSYHDVSTMSYHREETSLFPHEASGDHWHPVGKNGA